MYGVPVSASTGRPITQMAAAPCASISIVSEKFWSSRWQSTMLVVVYAVESLCWCFLGANLRAGLYWMVTEYGLRAGVFSMVLAASGLSRAAFLALALALARSRMPGMASSMAVAMVGFW